MNLNRAHIVLHDVLRDRAAKYLAGKRQIVCDVDGPIGNEHWQL